MALVGAQRAAELTGKSKSTIQRAMKSGKISYEVDGNGRRVIDVSELDRAFGLMPQDSESKDQKAVEAEIEKATHMLEMERMKMRIRMLEDQLDVTRDQVSDLKEQRDQWQKQAQQTLITSQYSQKQAEELKEEIKERERRARERRQQMMEQRMKGMKKMKSDNENRPANPSSNADRRSGFDIQGLWHKFKSPDEKAAAATDAPAQPAEGKDDEPKQASA